MTDEELMQAYIQGDIESFRMLYQRHKDRVMGYLNARLKSQDEAEDVFQEVFSKLHIYRFKYKDSVPFLAWLFTIAKNTLIDHVRKQTTQNKYFQIDHEKVANVPDAKVNSLSIAEAFSELSTLNAKQRQALELRFNDDLSFSDIAARMDTTPSNIRQVISRAKRLLRGLMLDKEIK
jgi:RNA polymerase sigma factor (sigma-70 family)